MVSRGEIYNSLFEVVLDIHHTAGMQLRQSFDCFTSSSLSLSLSLLSLHSAVQAVSLCRQPCMHDAQLNSKLDLCALLVRALITRRRELLPQQEQSRLLHMSWYQGDGQKAT